MGCTMKFPPPMKCCLFCLSMSPWLGANAHIWAASEPHHPSSPQHLYYQHVSGETVVCVGQGTGEGRGVPRVSPMPCTGSAGGQ